MMRDPTEFSRRQGKVERDATQSKGSVVCHFPSSPRSIKPNGSIMTINQSINQYQTDGKLFSIIIGDLVKGG